MSRAGVRSPRRKSRSVATTTAKTAASAASSESLGATKKNPKFHRFIGVSLGGGKTDKTSLSVVEFYPAQKKIFLSRLFDKIATEGEVSGDAQIYRLITQFPGPAESVAFDVPLQLPKCITCVKRCPGYEDCKEPEIIWMWKQYRAQALKKSPPRLFTPYTERCVEQYLQTELEEPFHQQHALGSNLAPLTARALFLKRRLRMKTIEVFPKLSLWRIGNALHIPKSQLRFHRHWEAGHSARQSVLDKMMDKNVAFIYDQDVKTLVDSPQAFDSFIGALTGLLSFSGLCEARPKGVPRQESWIEIPRKIFVWP
jgi:Protein of unknown function (DUF429)